MAKLYKIQLTEAGKKIKDKPENAEIRKVELDALGTCVSLAASREKDIKKYHFCNYLHSQILDVVESGKTEIRDLSREDIDNIVSGFALATDMQQMLQNGEIRKGRPPIWMFCMGLWEQIDKPVEQDSDSEKE